MAPCLSGSLTLPVLRLCEAQRVQADLEGSYHPTGQAGIEPPNAALFHSVFDFAKGLSQLPEAIRGCVHPLTPCKSRNICYGQSIDHRGKAVRRERYRQGAWWFTKDASGDFFESDRYVLSSAVGHLLELCVPDEFEVKRGKWSSAL